LIFGLFQEEVTRERNYASASIFKGILMVLTASKIRDLLLELIISQEVERNTLLFERTDFKEKLKQVMKLEGKNSER